MSIITLNTASRRRAVQQAIALPVRIVRSLRALFFAGNRFFCPICGLKTRKFRNAGSPVRLNAQCWRCGALERHRLMALFFLEQSQLFPIDSQSNVLHIAPEPFISAVLNERLNNYLTIDLLRRDIDIAASITNLPLPDSSCDGLFCNHVLEHISDDRRALSELRRVLRPDGWALLSVPVKGEHTQEDPTILDPDDRRRLYGQEDHVRQYGLDFASRVADAQFSVVRLTATEAFSQDLIGPSWYYGGRGRLLSRNTHRVESCPS